MWIIIGAGLGLVFLVCGILVLFASIACAKIDKVQDEITKY